MPAPYLPPREADLLAWMETFSAGIAANPALYQLTAADAAAIDATVDDFAAARVLAIDPATRTPVTVNAKDVARNAAVQICRQYVILIKFNAGVADADKIAIGVRPVNPSRTPIDPPTTSPLIDIIGATPGAHTLRFSDTNTPASSAKPFGAISLQLFVAVADTAVSDPALAKFMGAFTRNPVGIAFTAEEGGKLATYFARWASRRGDTGPWSLPVAMQIAA